ncbi:MAG: sensor domain-containing diguanylate cyclase [Nitrospirota bacterium]|nr:sensor domain-containing diguanylate cyclase [Nitrospirota bacterium]
MIKKGLPFLLLFLTYLGLLLEFPLKRRGLWFLFSSATVSVYTILHILKKEKNYSIEFLFSLALLIEGSVHAFAIPWLRMAYFPFMVFITAFYGQKTVISLLLLIPFLELGNFINGERLIEEITFILSLAATAGISLFLKDKMEKTNMLYGSKNNPPESPHTPLWKRGARGEFKGGMIAIGDLPRREGLDEIKSFNDEKVISHYLETMFKPDEEIKELLMVAKNIIFADSVTLFMSAGSILSFRCSTEESGTIIPSDGGLINLCIKEKKPLISSDIIEKKLEVGYLKKDKISSLVAVPVMDGNFPLGVITADSARFHAFSSADSDILQMFSKQLMRILQRERVYPQIYRSHTTLKVLHEESSKLLSSLNMDVIVQSLIDGAYRIAPSEIVFFIAKGKEIEVLRQLGLPAQKKKIFTLKGTLLDMVVKNKEPFYLSDVRHYRSPIMPFKTDNLGSVFVLPMLYEKEILGMLALLSEKINALSPYQIELLEVLGNQASTSIANARFHAEIERLAITDGLTGLFNHRHFQERLSQEFSRIDRFSEPLSVLIIDIDHFKKINDTYGHPVGDAVLKGVADKIRKTIRNIDISARYGGEEFAVILIGTDERGAMNMAERLRKAVMNKTFSADKNTFNVTISIGISTYTKGIKRKEELIEKADKALYQAKRGGRNRSILWSEINR